jgi:hypothetical protein
MERLCRRPFRPMADYALARASATAKLTAELHAQARQNGRVLDDFVFRIGGSETLKVEADLDKFIPRLEFKGWKVFFETWPHDILLRTNMATSVWQDMPAMVHGGVSGRLGAGQGRGGDPRVRVPEDVGQLRGRARHRLLPVGPDDLRLAQNDAAASVSSGVLHLPVRKAGASEVSHSNLAIYIRA